MAAYTPVDALVDPTLEDDELGPMVSALDAELQEEEITERFTLEGSGMCPVPSRPSVEFSAYGEAEVAPAKSFMSGAGQWAFVVCMLTIIGTAGMVALREHADDPELRGLARVMDEIAPHMPRARALSLVSREQQPARTWVRPAPLPAMPATQAAPAAIVAEARAPERAANIVKSAQAAAPIAAAPIKVKAAPEPKHARVVLGKAPKAAPVRSQARASVARESLRGSWEEARTLARDEYAAGRYAQAVAAYERAVLANPSHALTLSGLGAARMQTGNVAGAIEAYRRALKLSPNNAGIEVALARAYVANDDDTHARALYQHVLARDPGNVAASSGLERL